MKVYSDFLEHLLTLDIQVASKKKKVRNVGAQIENLWLNGEFFSPKNDKCIEQFQYLIFIL